MLVLQPSLAFQDGNPLLVTEDGEFVATNLVLTSVSLVVAAFGGRAGRELPAR